MNPIIRGLIAGAAGTSALNIATYRAEHRRAGLGPLLGWATADWAADLVPHLAYGAVAAAVCDGLR